MTTPTTTDLSMRDRNLRIALLTAVRDAIDEQVATERAAHRELLVQRYDEDGNKSFDVRLPDSEKVATVSLSVPKDETLVDDPDALLAWAIYAAPELITETHIPAQPEQVIPAQPARTDIGLDPKRVTELLTKHVKPAGEHVVHKDTGELVPGVRHKRGGAPRSFSVRFADDGRDAIARAWRNGVLEHITIDTPLPAIEGGES